MREKLKDLKTLLLTLSGLALAFLFYYGCLMLCAWMVTN
jgi:hypothetical protein